MIYCSRLYSTLIIGVILQCASVVCMLLAGYLSFIVCMQCMNFVVQDY